MKAANRYLVRICHSTGEKEPSAAIASFVRSRRELNESLNVLAARLGVNRITEEPMAFEGGVFRLANGERVIKLNSASPPSRKKFTLAHEIGHLMLGKPGLRSSCGEDPDLEKACDSIAAELLMPFEDIKAFARSLGAPSPEKLKIVASRYAVSLHAAAVRLHIGLQLWKCFIACWARYPHVKTEWFVGRRVWDRTDPELSSLDLALSSTTPVESKEYWYRCSSAQPVWLKLLRISNDRVLGLIGFVS